MHLILTGATGLVGTAALRAMISAPEVTRISILSRRHVAMADAISQTDDGKKKSVQVLIHENFAAYEPALLEKLKDATGCVWALGIPYRMSFFDNARNKDEYIMITHKWPLAAARAFATLSPHFNFVYVSGEGATQSPSFLTPFFGRVKGDAETSLSQLSKSYEMSRVMKKPESRKTGSENTKSSLQCYSVRPGFVDAAGHDEIQSYIPQPHLLHAVMGVALGPIIRNFVPSMHSPTMELGKVLVQLAIREKTPDEHTQEIDVARILNAGAISRLASDI